MAGQVTGDESLEELQNLVAKLQKNVDWLMQGNLSSKNVREIGGYLVSSTEFKSRDGDVGLSSADDATDPVMLWAGSVLKDSAPWRVHKSGKMVATGALIQSRDGTYPRIVFDPENDLFGAYGSETQSIVIEAFGNTLTPYLQWVDGTNEVKMYLSGTQLKIISADVGMKISVLGDLELNPVDLYLTPDNLIHVRTWSDIQADTLSNESLQDALDLKVNVIGDTGSAGPFNCGFPIGTVFNDAAGNPHTWQGVPIHVHSRT